MTPTIPSRRSRTGAGLGLVVLMAFVLVTASLSAPGGAAAAEPRPDATVTAASGLNLRFGPSLESTVLDVMPAGSVVAVIGDPENGFVPVTFDGMSGYAYGDYLGDEDAVQVAAPEAVAAVPVVAAGPTDIVSIIYAAADAYGQPRQDMLRVATCESGLNPAAYNPAGWYGLFQFVPSTFATTPYAGYDIFDAVANANAAAWMWSVGRRGEWTCQ